LQETKEAEGEAVSRGLPGGAFPGVSRCHQCHRLGAPLLGTNFGGCRLWRNDGGLVHRRTLRHCLGL